MDEKVQLVNSIISRIADGDRQALDSLYRNFSGLFFSMAKKYLYDKSKAEDVVSKVLLRLVKSAKTFKRGHNGLNWLFKSIHNEAIDTNKADGKNCAINIDDRPDICAVLNLEETIINDMSLKEGLEGLSETERKALYYKFWEGLTVREIAKVTAASRSTAQRIIEGALKKLKDRLE